MKELCVLIGILLLCPTAAFAQADPNRFELGVQVASTTSSQFDATDVGLGGRLSWRPIGLLGLESEINFYPKDFPAQGSFSRARVEGLFGVTMGPRVGAARPFGKARAGFLSVRGASQPFVCILIFPPPLSCELGAGRTLPAFDVGGGIELLRSRNAFARFEIGDRVLKYPGPVLDNKGAVRAESFLSHDFRFSAGAGVRF
jgi:hypothetical protein